MSIDTAFFLLVIGWSCYSGWKKYKAATENIDPQVKAGAKKLAGGLLWKVLKSRM